MADTQKDDATPNEAESHPTPLEMVRETQNAQRDTMEAARHNESIKDTEFEGNKQDKSDNPGSSNPRFQPNRELG